MTHIRMSGSERFKMMIVMMMMIFDDDDFDDVF